MNSAIAKPRYKRIQGFHLLLLLASERVRQAGIRSGQLRKDRLGQDAVGLIAGKSRYRRHPR